MICHRHLHRHLCDHASSAASAAAAAAAFDSVGLVPQLRQQGKTGFINTCAHVLRQGFSESGFELAHVDFSIAVAVHELQGKESVKEWGG
jgi:hypothetical protein